MRRLVLVITSFVEEIINQGRLVRVNYRVTLNFVELDPLPGQQQGREGLKQVISAFRTAFPDIHWVIEEMLGEEDNVFSRFTWLALIAANSLAFQQPASR